MRSVKELTKIEGKVYVYLSSPETCARFFADAEAAGFVFGDGAKPTQKHAANIIAINKDGTMNYVGTNGRIAYGSGTKKIGNDELVRIDYEKFISGDTDNPQ